LRARGLEPQGGGRPFLDDPTFLQPPVRPHASGGGQDAEHECADDDAADPISPFGVWQLLTGAHRSVAPAACSHACRYASARVRPTARMRFSPFVPVTSHLGDVPPSPID
jgi:hypothetical protein